MADHRVPPFPATPPLVGREREMATLRDALASAMAGRGSLVLIGVAGSRSRGQPGRGEAGHSVAGGLSVWWR